MKPQIVIVLTLSLAFAAPGVSKAQDSTRTGGTKSTHPLPTSPDTTMLTGSGLNTTGGPIDRIDKGGVWRKERGSRIWSFIPSTPVGSGPSDPDRGLQELIRLHGNEPRDIVVAVRDTADLTRLKAFRIGVSQSLPCTLAVRVLYRQLPEMKKAGLLFWGPGDRRPTRPDTLHPAQPTRRPPPPPRGAQPGGTRGPALPDGATSTLACPQTLPFNEGFEVCGAPSDSWDVWYYGSTSWGDQSSSCAYVHGGSWSLSASGGGGPCFGYDNNENTWTENPAYFDMSNFSQYTISYWVYYNIEATYDYFNWYYDTGGGWQQNGHYTGSSSGWIQRTLVFTNSGHIYDRVKMKFEFLSDYVNTGPGVYVDDITITGTQLQPNLTSYTPPGWSGPIVPSSVLNTTTTGTLYAGSPTYIDWAVQNNGSGNTTNTFYIDYYLDGVYIGGDVKSGLNAGTYHTNTDWSYTVPTPGNHTLRMVVDSYNNVSESNEGDNTYQQSFYWNPSDLIVQSIVPSTTTPTVGQTISATVTIKNLGPAPAAGTFYTRFYKNLAFHPTQCQAGYDALNTSFSLASGATEAFTVTGLTSNVAGTWTMWAYVDDCNFITSESSETNNYNASGVTVTWGSGTVTLTGTFAYDDSVTEATDVPLRGAHVVLYQTHNGQSSGDSLATTYTNASGQFAFTNILNRDPVDQGYLDVFVRAFYQADSGFFGHSVVSVEDANSARYYFQTPTVNNVANGTYPFGVIKPATHDYVHNGAAHIYTAILMGRDWLAANGTTIPSVYMFWYPGYAGVTGYTKENRTIAVNSTQSPSQFKPDEWDDAVMLHEYGHHVSRQLGFDVNPGVPHRFLAADSLDGQPSFVVAWSEGWATAFACYAQVPGPSASWRDAGVNAAGTLSQARIVNVESGTYSDPNVMLYPVNDQGATWEVPVAALLWDVYDSQDDNPNGDAYSDRLSDGFGPLWDVLANRGADSMYTVPNFYRLYRSRWATTSERLTALNQTFAEHGMLGALTTAVPGEGAIAGGRLMLQPVSPNPTRRAARLDFVVPTSQEGRRVTLRLYDVAGRMVRSLIDGSLPAGSHAVEWHGEADDGNTVGAGVYFVHLECGSERRTERVVVLH